MVMFLVQHPMMFTFLNANWPFQKFFLVFIAYKMRYEVEITSIKCPLKILLHKRRYFLLDVDDSLLAKKNVECIAKLPVSIRPEVLLYIPNKKYVISSVLSYSSLVLENAIWANKSWHDNDTYFQAQQKR